MHVHNIDIRQRYKYIILQTCVMKICIIQWPSSHSGDVLEVLPAGSKKIWTRDLPAVVADAIPATNWDMRAFSYEAHLGGQIFENIMLVASVFKVWKFWSHEENDPDVWKQRPFWSLLLFWCTNVEWHMQIWSTYKAWNKGCAAHGPSSRAGDANGVWWHEPWQERAPGSFNIFTHWHIPSYYLLLSWYVYAFILPPNIFQDPVLPYTWDDQ